MDVSRRALLSAATLVAGTLPAFPAGSSGDQTKAIQKALDRGGMVTLPPGRIAVSGLRIANPIVLTGTPGRSVLVSADGGTILAIEDTENVSVTGIGFEGGGAGDTLVEARNASLRIDNCAFHKGAKSGLALNACSGRITGNRFGFIEHAALFALDSKGLEISGNHVHDIGNNGIQVWTSDNREDGSLVVNNRVERIEARAGGSGQNGNGINIYRAGNVVVSGNRVSDCAYSAIRNNAGWNCQIVGNSVSRTGEVAVYVEFAFQGAVVSNNLIEDVAMGISITNLDVDGRLAVCAGNIVRNVKGGGSIPTTTACGIHAEADTAITGNVVENAKDIGISLGWGRYGRNLSATGNIIRNCGKGFTVSLHPETAPALVANNIIAGSTLAAIMGVDHDDPVTGDLGQPGAEIPARLTLSGNLVT